MKLRRTCYWSGLSLVLFGYFFQISGLSAQTLEELEAEVLTGNSKTSAKAAPVVEESAVQGTQSSGTTVEDNSVPDSPNPNSSDDDDSYVFSKESSQKAAPDEKTYKDIDEFINGPKSIPFKHIFVVKHQYIFKKNRHELIPFSLGIQPADSFRKQVSMGISYLYHLSEDFAIEALHLQFYTNLRSGFADDLLHNTSQNGGTPLEIERIEPVMSVGGSLQWSPFKGKTATDANIYHFEGYLFLGGGMTQYEEGSSPMIMGGVGARMFMNRRSTLKFEIRDYHDFKDDAGNRLNLMVGAGILLGASAQ